MFFLFISNSDFCPIHHKLIGFYNRDEKCLLRGTNRVFKKNSLCFIFKGLIQQRDNFVSHAVQLTMLILKLVLRIIYPCD